MAMRPAIRRQALILLVVGIAQWAYILMALNGNWWPLEKTERILLFCGSSFLGAWLVMGSLLYMALKGKQDSSQ